MTQEEFLEERVANQINWFSKKSKTNKRYHLICQLLVISLSAIIPFLVGMIESKLDFWSILTGVMGVTVTIVSGANILYHFKEKWSVYRMTSESLKKERILFLTNSGDYKNSKSPYQDFVDKIERILTQEKSSWKDLFGIEKLNS